MCFFAEWSSDKIRKAERAVQRIYNHNKLARVAAKAQTFEARGLAVAMLPAVAYLTVRIAATDKVASVRIAVIVKPIAGRHFEIFNV